MTYSNIIWSYITPLYFVWCSSHLHQCVCANDSTVFHSPLIFRHLTVCRLLWSPRFRVGFDSARTELRSSEFRRPFIFPSTHILIYIYHLLRTLLMSPSFSHFTTLPPSDSPAFSRFLNIRIPSLAVVSRRTFHMLTTSLFLFPIVPFPPPTLVPPQSALWLPLFPLLPSSFPSFLQVKGAVTFLKPP